MNAFGALLRKDLLVEYRGRSTFTTTLFFGLLVLVVGTFALSAAGDQFTAYAPGILWIGFLFSGLLYLNHSLLSEKEDNTLAGIQMAPVTPGHIFLAKLCSAVAFIVALHAILLPLFHIFFNYRFTTNSLWLFGLVILASIGYSALGVLLSTMALGLKNREIVLSALLFPLMIPLLIMVVKASIILLNGWRLDHFYSWLKLIVAFDVIFVVLSYWSYFWILEEI